MKKRIKIDGKKHGFFYIEKGKNLPIILYLHGGPGSPEYPIFQSKIHPNYLNNFNMCYYDHVGCGLSFSKTNYDISSLIEDVKIFSEYLILEYNTDKIILMGHSFGSFIGIQVVQKYPHLFFFYVGISQVIDTKRSEEYIYDDLIQICLKNNDFKNLKNLKNEKSKENFPTRKYFSSTKTKILEKYHIGLTRKKLPRYFMLKSLLFFKEYTIADKINYVRGLINSSKILLPEIIEYKTLSKNISYLIPIFLVHGKYDYQISRKLITDFFDQMDCPKKKLSIFEHSAHFPNIEETKKFESLLELFSNEIISKQRDNI